MKSEKNKSKIIQELQEVYCEKLDNLQIPYRKVTVESTFGDTSVIITGSEQKNPLVILHAENSAAPFAIEIVKDLRSDFQIIAIDIPHSINKLAENGGHQNEIIEQWMFEILTWLNIKNISLVGISFGALIAMRSMAFDSRRIKGAILIAPLGLASLECADADLSAYDQKKHTRNLKKEFIINTCYDRTELNALSFLSLLTEANQLKIPSHEIENEKLAQIKTPLHIILIDEDPWLPYSSLIENARKKLPTLEETLLLFHTKHLPARNHYPIIMEYIKKVSNS